MTKNPRAADPDFLRKQIEHSRIGDRDLAKKPGKSPPPQDGTESEGVVWDDDQSALLDNQDPNKLKRSGQQGSE
jgi:hypothetical protein